jgi:hypothetical protein
LGNENGNIRYKNPAGNRKKKGMTKRPVEIYIKIVGDMRVTTNKINFTNSLPCGSLSK